MAPRKPKLQGPMQAAIAKTSAELAAEATAKEEFERLFNAKPQEATTMTTQQTTTQPAQQTTQEPEQDISTLLEQAEKINAQIAEVRRSRRSEALSRAKRLIEAFQISQSELYGAPIMPTKGKRPAKYRDPATGQVWSGFGRAPRWYVIAENKDALLIPQH